MGKERGTDNVSREKNTHTPRSNSYVFTSNPQFIVEEDEETQLNFTATIFRIKKNAKKFLRPIVTCREIPGIRINLTLDSAILWIVKDRTREEHFIGNISVPQARCHRLEKLTFDLSHNTRDSRASMNIGIFKTKELCEGTYYLSLFEKTE